MAEHYDLVVIGAGMVGASVALAAAQAGFQVLLIERQAPPLSWDQTHRDLRVSALTRASQVLLNNLGVWQALPEQQACAYQDMRVWDARGRGEIHFSAADLGEPDLGHILENRELVAALWRALEDHPAVEVQIGQVTAWDRQSQRVELADGSSLSAELIVAADGGNSQMRELAGIQTLGHLYDQHALVATVAASQGTGLTAWQRFMPSGPLALLPLSDAVFSIVWSNAPDEVARLKELPSAQFNAALTQASEAVCGELTLLGPRAGFPLRLQRAASYVQPGLALVGDAAHVIHPLAGQGVNLGLLDAGALIDVLSDARAQGRGLGDYGVLRRYERARKGHNLAVQMAMDAFKQLFGNQNPALHLIRNLGLGLADRIPPLRRQFERVALGQGVELPRLSRTSRRSI